MKVLLIEDESIAMRMLRKVILAVNPKIEIIEELESVAEALKWFELHPNESLDLIFSDIQLSDGLSFDIFDRLEMNTPIIFTTAYNEYAIRAFKVNGIDYLLKPIKEADVSNALKKIEKSRTFFSRQQLVDLQTLIQNLQIPSFTPDPTFIAYQKDKMIPVQGQTIAWFHTQNQIVTAVLDNSTKVHLNETLEEIEKRLPKSSFFRVNRQYIIARKAIFEVQIYFNNRLAIKLVPSAQETVVVSRERVSLFRNWLQNLL